MSKNGQNHFKNLSNLFHNKNEPNLTKADLTNAITVTLPCSFVPSYKCVIKGKIHFPENTFSSIPVRT